MTLFLPRLPSRQRIYQTLKIIVPLAIIGWLLAGVEARKWIELRDQPKDWWMLAVALSLTLASTAVTFVRWFMLVRIMEIPFRLQDAFRLGFLGYLLNFISAGAVGGDLFKAFFLARENRGQRAKAVASVLVDRILGLYALLLVASAGFLLTDLTQRSVELATLAKIVYAATAVGGMAVVAMLVPGFTNGRLTRWLTTLPKVGGLLAQLILAVRLYRSRWLALSIALAMSVMVHAMLALSIYLTATSLFHGAPTVKQHLIVVPTSLVVATLPISPAGLGTFEVALAELYRLIGGASAPPGVTVALAYRLITIIVATIGAVYYVTRRSEVRRVLAEAARDLEGNDRIDK